MVDYEIIPSLIRVKRKLSYDEVDDLLEAGDEDLSVLFNIAATRETERLKTGALKITKREVLINIGDEGGLQLVEFDESGPARNLVGEMMILANVLSARFGLERGIPLIFRSQEPPDEQPPNNIPEGPALDFAIKMRLKRSTVSTEPRPHSGLGVDSYIQITSPIRRYLDLCNQRQLVEFWRTGKPAYTTSEITDICQDVEGQLSVANSVSKETRRFWLLRFLELERRNTSLEGVVVRTDGRTPLVELSPIYLYFPVKTDLPVRLGETIRLSIAALDPRWDYIRLERSSR